MDYFDRCKAEDAELTLAGVKQHMMIANETVAANNLELAQRFVNDSSLQANFLTACPSTSAPKNLMFPPSISQFGNLVIWQFLFIFGPNFLTVVLQLQRRRR